MISPALRVARSPQLYNPVPDGCVLHLPLWHPELSGAVFNSTDDFRHVVTVNNAVYGGTGRTFDGTDDWIDIPNHTALRLKGDFTLEVWFMKTGGAAAMYVIDNNYSDGYGLSWSNVNQMRFWRNNELIYSTNDLTSTTTFYHVVGTVAGTAGTVYVNGAYNNSGALATAPAFSAPNLDIGQRNDGTLEFTGIIGEVRIYKRALTAAEVLHSYNTTNWRYQ